MEHDSRTDAALLAAAAAGEAEAFGTFYRRHVDWVMRHVARRVADRDAVADLTAETFAAALIAVPRFDERRGSPGAWLHGIVSHHLAHYHRRGAVARRARSRLGIGEVALEDAELAQLRAAEEVDRMLATLPGEQGRAVRERVVNDREYAELAVELGVSEAVVRQRVSRGLGTLRRRWPQERS